MKIKWKLVTTFVVIALFPLCMFGVLFNAGAKETFTTQIINERHLAIQEKTSTTQVIIKNFRDEVLLLSDLPPVQGIIRSKPTEVDPLDGSTLNEWQKRFQIIFASVIKRNPSIQKIMYLDEYGDELVRVEQEGETQVIIGQELGNQSDTEYFQTTQSLTENDIYTSNVKLHNNVPVIQLATPVFSEETGNAKGMIIMEVNMSNIFELFKKTTIGEIKVTDQGGNFLLNPELEKVFNTKHNYFTEHPELISNTEQQDFKDHYDRGKSEYRIWRKIYYNPTTKEKYWIIYSVINEKDLLAPFQQIVNSLITTILICLVFIAAPAILIAQSIAQPIQELTSKALKIARSDVVTKTHIKITSKDEIGKLSKAFNVMIDQVYKLNKGLEKEVKKKTKALVEEVKNTKKFHKAVEASTDAVMITSPKGKIMYVNPAWEKLTGYTLKHALKKPRTLIRSKKTPRDVLKTKEKYMDQGRIFTTDQVLYKSKDGMEHQMELSVVPIKEKGGILFFASIARDITRRKEIEKMKDEFISLASHQLRTPLAAMKWFGEMLLAGDAGKLKKEQKDIVQNIQNSNERMIELVNALLDISRIESGQIVVEKQPTDFTQLIETVMQDVQVKVKEKNITLVTSIHPELKDILVDPKLVHQIYNNLLSNAIKYSPKDTEITVMVSRKNNMIISQISDEGYGIPKKQQKRIFQKFFRADNVTPRVTEGTGLGLYLAKIITESFGGEMWFKSEEDKGTTFWFTLPTT